MVFRGEKSPPGLASVDAATAESDECLLSRWAAGDNHAGGVLIQRHFATVYRFLRTKTRHDVEDLVQQTFTACIEARARFLHRSSFKTFLLGIARYQLFEFYRRCDKSGVVDFSSRSVQDLGTSPTGQLIRREDHRVLAQALQHLPLELQIILELTYWEELDGPQLAEVLEIPLNTVYSRLRRAKQCLRAELLELAPDLRVACAADAEFDRWAKDANHTAEPA